MSYEEIIMARFQQKEHKDQDEELADSRIRVSELAQGPTTADNETDKHDFYYEKENVLHSNSGDAVESMQIPVKTCRFCYGEELPLIQPCNCKGSMAFVHGHCLG